MELGLGRIYRRYSNDDPVIQQENSRTVTEGDPVVNGQAEHPRKIGGLVNSGSVLSTLLGIPQVE